MGKQSSSPGLCVQRQSWQGADLRATTETLLGGHSRLTQCFDDFAHLRAPGCAVIFSTLRLPFQMGAMLVRGNVPMLQRLAFFSFGHHNSSRKQLISLDLSVWPPTKGSALGHAHFPGVLTQFHASTMTEVSLFVNKCPHFEELVPTHLSFTDKPANCLLRHLLWPYNYSD